MNVCRLRVCMVDAKITRTVIFVSVTRDTLDQIVKRVNSPQLYKYGVLYLIQYWTFFVMDI
jgi:hypothetical protein